MKAVEITYTRERAPVFDILARAKLPGFNCTLLALSIPGKEFYQLMRESDKGTQSIAWITKESALALLNDLRFKKTEYGIIALQNLEPAKEQWDLETLFAKGA